MKYTTVIDPSREEEVIIRVRCRTRAIEALEAYLDSLDAELLGYGQDGQIVPLSPSEVYCFTVKEGKVCALTEKETLIIRLPLYAVEEMLNESFIRINQSCLVNIRGIARFDTSISGTLMVTLQNGHRDYVSRRQLKTVKERMGIKR